MNQIWWALGSVVAVLALVLTSCAVAPTPNRPIEAALSRDGSQNIILGDIDPDEPIKKVEPFQPLADIPGGKPGGIQHR